MIIKRIYAMICVVMLLAGFLLVLVGANLDNIAVVIIGGCLIVLASILNLFFGRCPNCKSFAASRHMKIQKNAIGFCPTCGAQIEYR